MSRSDRLSSYKTVVFYNDGFTNVIYHHTVIVKFNQEQIILNSGGWQTHTTKQKINQSSNQFGLNYHVYQENFIWYVVINGEWDNPIVFKDNMILYRDFPSGKLSLTPHDK